MQLLLSMVTPFLYIPKRNHYTHVCSFISWVDPRQNSTIILILSPLNVEHPENAVTLLKKREELLIWLDPLG